MKTINLILLMGGASIRFNQNINKVLLEVNKLPLYIYSLNTFDNFIIDKYILVIRKEDENKIKEYLDNTAYANKIIYTYSGPTRTESVKNGLKLVDADYVLIHDAARVCVNTIDVCELINQTINNNYQVSYLGSKCINTLRKQLGDSFENIDRSNVYEVSTPQMFHQDVYNIILNNNDNNITDEISLFNHHKVLVVEEKHPNPKLTYQKDLDYITYLLNNQKEYFIGQSFDFHPYEINTNNNLILGGITFKDYPKLKGWSDGDCLYHSVGESILGALSMGDLGTYFPDNDEKYHHMDSKDILLFVKKELETRKIRIQNIDITLYLEEPKLKNYKLQMINNIENILECHNVSVKASTLNTLISGNKISGVGSRSIVLLYKVNKL